MFVLGLDTTTEYLHLGFLESGQPLVKLDQSVALTESLAGQLKEVFRQLGKEPSQLACLGVVTGPGGYTSTRAGVVIAKTIAWVYQIPLLGFSRAEVLLYQFRHQPGWVCPVLNVRQQEVYSSIGRFADGMIAYLQPPAVYGLADWQELLASVGEPVTIVGDSVLATIPASIDGLAIAQLTWLYFQQGQRPSFAEVHPLYARSPVWAS